jgi:hypothetical protein
MSIKAPSATGMIWFLCIAPSMALSLPHPRQLVECRGASVLVHAKSSSIEFQRLPALFGINSQIFQPIVNETVLALWIFDEESIDGTR